MSVLKYNNNGTWEGLNIDHASTADSALYDANGNVISSTYLPRSAGASNPVTDEIYLESENEVVGRLRPVSSSYANAIYLHATDGTNITTTIGGNSLGQAFVAGNGDTADAILLRPNGLNSSTGQVVLDTDGQMYGGHPYSSATKTSQSIAANTAVNLGSISKPSKATYCIQFGFLSFTPNAAGKIQLAVNGTVNQFYVTSGTAWQVSVSGLYEGSAAFSITPSMAGQLNSSTLRVIWF